MTDALLIATWCVSGIVPILVWKFKESEVSLLDALCGVILGSVLGPLIPTVALLHSVKLKRTRYERPH